MTITVKKPQTASYWKPLTAVFLIALALLLWPHFATRPSSPLTFEVAGFEGDAQIYDLTNHAWRTPKRGETFGVSQKLMTGADGTINIQVENEIQLRLKGNSELENKECRVIGAQEVYALKLDKGTLLGATTRPFERKQTAGKAVFRVLLAGSVATVHGALFRMQVPSQRDQPSQVGVLRGFVEVKRPSTLLFKSEGVRIRGLENVNVTSGAIPPSKKVTVEEWGRMKEAYELLARTAAMEAEQIDLSKHAGTFFNYVFDHGTFYTPKFGFAGRDFSKDPDSGQVMLTAEYDVFPTGSFVGIYIKTRNFDISKYRGLSFQVRRCAEEGVPDSFSLELKSKGNVVRRYAPRHFERDWKLVEFEFHARMPTLVNEVVFVFTNARVGEAKKGMLEFRQLNLIPLPPVSSAVPKSDARSLGGTVPKTDAKPIALTAPKKAVKPMGVPATPSAEAQPPVASTVSSPAEDKTTVVPKEVPLQ